MHLKNTCDDAGLLDNKGFRPQSFLRSVSSKEKLWMMENCRKGLREAVGNQRLSNYDNVNKISTQAGLRAIQKCGKKNHSKAESLIGEALSDDGEDLPSFVDEKVKEMLKKYGSDNLKEQEHKNKKVFWSRYTF